MKILTIQENGFIKVEEITAEASCKIGTCNYEYAKRIADHNKEQMEGEA